MMITNLILIYPAEPFLRKGNTAIINICPKICGQPGKLYFKKEVALDHYIEKKKVAEFFSSNSVSFIYGDITDINLFSKNIICVYHIPLQEPAKEKY